MDKLRLNSIKHENILNVFNTIIDYGDRISRAEIAEKTELSIMTVGKIVDAFLNRNILLQHKEIKDSAGRKAGLVVLNPNRVGLILDLTTYNFSMTITDFKAEFVDRIVYQYNVEYNYQENLFIFFRNVRMYLDKRFDDDTEYYGRAILLPGYYDAQSDNVDYERIPELKTMRIKTTVEELSGSKVTYIESDADAAARSIIKDKCYKTMLKANGENTVFYMYVCRYNTLRSAIIFNGSVMHGMSHHAGSIGDIYVHDNMTLQSVIDKNQRLEECVYEFCHMFHSVINLINPNTFIVECDTVKISNEIEQRIKTCLLEDYKLKESMMPNVVISNDVLKHSNRGAAIELRDQWFRKLL